MADYQQLLMPSLLERLTDRHRASNDSRETPESWMNTRQDLHESLKRDLEWLFNTTNLAATEDLEPYPEVSQSVLNYGLPTLVGRTMSGVEPIKLERQIRNTILRYEPRIQPSLRVRVVRDESGMNQGALSFDIEGEIHAQPTPIYLLLRTELDLSTHTALIKDLDA